MPDQPRPAPAHWAVVHPARQLPVVSGANLGDPIAGDGLCEPGDVYRLVPEAAGMRLRLGLCDGGGRAVAEGSEIGAPGVRTEIWMMILLGVLAMLLVEWVTYHRRLTV